MKIGILTFHAAKNYGAVLQCFALQEYLTQNSHEVHVIDYRPEYLKTSEKKGIKKILANFIKLVFIHKFNFQRINSFKYFIENKLNLYPYEQLNNDEKFDAIICGSDQIWNYKICGNSYDKMYFADFTSAKNAIRISYGASMGNTNMAEKQKKEFNTLLNNFNHISVREENIKNFIQHEFSIKSTIVLDPTLLVDNKIFNKIAKSPNRAKPYVLIYEIQHVKGLLELGKKIARSINAELVQLNGSYSTFFKKDVKNVQGRTPEEFIGYFKEASYVVTTSFHGTAFSIIYKRQFYALKQGNERDIRINTLLNSLDLLNRFIDKESDINNDKIDYLQVNQKLNKLRTTSEDFLSKSLNLDNNV